MSETSGNQVCAKCGAEFDSAKFCVKCGTPVAAAKVNNRAADHVEKGNAYFE